MPARQSVSEIESELERKRHQILTKTVDPDWYKRYAKILEYEERIYVQPLRELREEKAMLELLVPPPEGSDQIALERSRKLADAKGKKVKMVLQILDGDINVDVKSLKLSDEQSIVIEAPKEVKQQTLFWRKRAVRPKGYVLSPDSKWRLFWETSRMMRGLKRLAREDYSDKIKHKWIKAFRTLQGVSTFLAVLADISGATQETVKKIATDDFKKCYSLFDKSQFKATSVGNKLDQDVMFTLTKRPANRTREEAQNAAVALRVISDFAEFPTFLQNKICSVAWYLEVDEDRNIIRQGHISECFYFLLSGKAAILRISSEDKHLTVIGNAHVGSLIGEEAISSPGHREYTLRTLEKCKIIMVDCEDFREVCVSGDVDGVPPDHIVFLSQLVFMKFFPITQLVESTCDDIQVFYFRSGSLVCGDIFKSDFIYVIYRGHCNVVAEIVPRQKSVHHVLLPPISRPTKLIDSPTPPASRRSSSHRHKDRTSRSLDKTPTLHKISESQTIDQLQPIHFRDTSQVTSSDSKTSIESPRQPHSKRVSFSGSEKESQYTTWPFRASERSSKKDTKLMDAAAHELIVLSHKTREEWDQQAKHHSHWIQIKSLAEGDHVGIETLDLGDGVDEKPLRIAVVSEGATVVIMSKEFFLANATDYVRMDLRATGPTIPGQVSLDIELEKRKHWVKFQNEYLWGVYGSRMANKQRNWKYPLGIYTDSL